MPDKMDIGSKAGIFALIAVAFVAPVFFQANNYYMDLFIMLGIYVIQGNAMNLLLGYLIDFGNAIVL